MDRETVFRVVSSLQAVHTMATNSVQARNQLPPQTFFFLGPQFGEVLYNPEDVLVEEGRYYQVFFPVPSQVTYRTPGRNEPRLGLK